MCGTLTIEAKAEEEQNIRETIDEVLTQHLRRSIRVPFTQQEEVFHYVRGIINCRHASVSIHRQGKQVQISISTDGFDTGRYANKGGIQEETGIYQKVRKAITQLPINEPVKIKDYHIRQPTMEEVQVF